MDEWDKWFEKNKEDLYWRKYRLLHGLDPENTDTAEEWLHWRKFNKDLRRAHNTEDVEEALTVSPYMYKQYFLKKWWRTLNQEEKKDGLQYTWVNKGDGNFYGFDWWLPYFEEIGFITNTILEKPEESITLYRASEPAFARGMSWTDDYEMAKVFQSTNLLLLGDKYIYKTIVEPEDILAIIEGNVVAMGDDNEYVTQYKGVEYVVNHSKLKTILVEDDDGEWI